MTARYIATSALIFCLAGPSTVQAQDRGISIPDVFTPNPADAIVASEVTSALRVAGSMTPNWRPSTADLPLAEYMRACGASLEVDPDMACMARMVVTRDPSMDGGLVLFAFMDRVGEANGFRIILALYDMRTGEVARHVEAEVHRIEAPPARNRLAAEWIRQLTAPPAVAVADTPEPLVPSESPGEPGSDVPAETVAVEPRPTRVDTSVPDTIGWILVAAGAASAIGAAITGGLVLNLNGDERYNAYRSTWDASRVANVCDMAASDPSTEGRYALDVCNQAGGLETATHVLWAVSGGLAVTGMVFILFHPFSSTVEIAPSARFTPLIGPTGAGFDLTVAF